MVDVACALPMSAVDLRSVEVPKGNEAEVRQMAFEMLRDVFPDDFDDRVTGIWTHANKPQNTMTEVSAISVLSQVAESVAQNLHDAKLNCRVMDCIPFALVRAVQMAPDFQPAQPVVIVDWGYTSVTLIVAVNGKPEFVRVLRDCSGQTAIRSLFEGLGLLPKEARQLLSTVGLPAHNDSGASAALRRTVARLLQPWLRTFQDEIRKTIGYLRHHRSSIAPARLLLAGGIACTPHLTEFIQDDCDLPLDVWSLTGRPSEALFASASGLSTLGDRPC